MTVYAPTDALSVTIPTDRGGCGLTHQVTDRKVDCLACEPHIVGLRQGWAHTLEGVALTPDEIGEVERAEAQAKRQNQRTWADPAVLANVIGDAMRDGLANGQQPAAAPSLLAQIAGLSGQERAALRELLAATDPPVEAVDTTPLLPAPVLPPPVKAAPVKRTTGRA